MKPALLYINGGEFGVHNLSVSYVLVYISETEKSTSGFTIACLTVKFKHMFFFRANTVETTSSKDVPIQVAISGQL